MERYFLKRIISVEVNEARGINHYKVEDMFDELYDDGLTYTRYETVQNFNLTWEDIENRGGVALSNKKLSKDYGAEFDWEEDKKAVRKHRDYKKELFKEGKIG